MPGLLQWWFKATLNEQTDVFPVSPSQLKSNVVSLDCHISQYATVCQQLQAEVRSPPGEHGWEAGLPGTVGVGGRRTRDGSIRVWPGLYAGGRGHPACFAHLGF